MAATVVLRHRCASEAGNTSCPVLAVILLGVLHGMMLAVLLSILAAVRRFSQARVSVLGERGDTRDFVDAARHPEAAMLPGVLVGPQASGAPTPRFRSVADAVNDAGVSAVRTN